MVAFEVKWDVGNFKHLHALKRGLSSLWFFLEFVYASREWVSLPAEFLGGQESKQMVKGRDNMSLLRKKGKGFSSHIKEQTMSEELIWKSDKAL